MLPREKRTKEPDVTMLLKILLLIIVKEVIYTLYWICKGLCRDNRKRNKWLLAGYSGVSTLAAYLIFGKCGFKYPVIWSVLTSCLWAMMYDVIMSEKDGEMSLAGMSNFVILVRMARQIKNDQRSDRNFKKNKLQER